MNGAGQMILKGWNESVALRFTVAVEPRCKLTLQNAVLTFGDITACKDQIEFGTGRPVWIPGWLFSLPEQRKQPCVYSAWNSKPLPGPRLSLCGRCKHLDLASRYTVYGTADTGASIHHTTHKRTNGLIYNADAVLLLRCRLDCYLRTSFVNDNPIANQELKSSHDTVASVSSKWDVNAVSDTGTINACTGFLLSR